MNGFAEDLHIDWEVVYPGDYILRSVLLNDTELLGMRTKYRDFDKMMKQVCELVAEQQAKEGEAAEEARHAAHFGGAAL